MFRFLFQAFCAGCFLVLAVVARENGDLLLSTGAWFAGVVFALLAVFPLISD